MVGFEGGGGHLWWLGLCGLGVLGRAGCGFGFEGRVEGFGLTVSELSRDVGSGRQGR